MKIIYFSLFSRQKHLVLDASMQFYVYYDGKYLYLYFKKNDIMNINDQIVTCTMMR